MDSNKKILLVEVAEDEAPERIVLRDKLTQSGFAVVEAKDGEEGLGVALRDHPDVILLDLRMPKMDGMTMMGKLREDDWGKQVPVIVLTNYNANDQNVLKIITDRPSYYLLKTETPIKEVIDKIHEVLESRREGD